MSEPQPDAEAWKDQYDARTRVRMVVETLAEPKTTQAIADEADVAWNTAASELERLTQDKRVEPITIGDTTKYRPDPRMLFLEEVVELVDENGRDDLERVIIEYTEQQEAVQDEYGVDTLTELRNQIADSDLTSDGLKARRNAARTWDALNSELKLYRTALSLYSDLTETNGDVNSGETPLPA